MRTGIIYQNKARTKWINLVDGEKERVTLQDGDVLITRIILYYKKIKDVLHIAISYKGTITEVPVGDADLSKPIDITKMFE